MPASYAAGRLTSAYSIRAVIGTAWLAGSVGYPATPTTGSSTAISLSSIARFPQRYLPQAQASPQTAMTIPKITVASGVGTNPPRAAIHHIGLIQE